MLSLRPRNADVTSLSGAVTRVLGCKLAAPELPPAVAKPLLPALSLSLKKGATFSRWRTFSSPEYFFATNALRQTLRAFVAKKHSSAWRRPRGKSGALPEGNQHRAERRSVFVSR